MANDVIAQLIADGYDAGFLFGENDTTGELEPVLVTSNNEVVIKE